MVSTSGSKLLAEDALNALVTLLLPKTFILTPNIPEALVLLGPDAVIDDVASMVDAAKALSRMGPRYVLLKGGHLPIGDKTAATVADVFYDRVNDRAEVETKAYIESKHTHGTGCSLASSLASNLAKGLDVKEAVKEACRYVHFAIESAPGFGSGNGPISHMHSSYMTPYAP